MYNPFKHMEIMCIIPFSTKYHEWFFWHDNLYVNLGKIWQIFHNSTLFINNVHNSTLFINNVHTSTLFINNVHNSTLFINNVHNSTLFTPVHFSFYRHTLKGYLTCNSKQKGSFKTTFYSFFNLWLIRDNGVQWFLLCLWRMGRWNKKV